MKHLVSMSLLALSVWLTAACTEEDRLTPRDKREVIRELSVVTPCLQQTGGDLATRSEKVGDEGKIMNGKVWVIQFDGTAAANKVVKFSEVTLVNGTVTFPFDMVEDADQCRVYVVANVNPGVSEGTTLQSFEQKLVTYEASQTVNATTGLPMCDHKDFDPVGTATAPTFKLKAMVAKLIFKCTIDAGLGDFKETPTVTLENIPNGSFFGEPSDYTTAWLPALRSFREGNIEVGNAGETIYTWYIPENIAGQNTDVKRWIHRSIDKAPAKATYFEISGVTTKDVSVKIALFLGDPNNAADFNVRRNYAYTLTANIIGLAKADHRITMKGDFMYAEPEEGWTNISKSDDAFGI